MEKGKEIYKSGKDALNKPGINTAASKKGKTVLGKFPDYLELSEKLGARRFDIPMKIWESMSTAEKWVANKKFLDRLINRGDDIILATQVKNIKDMTGYFRKELDYLIANGFKLAKDGMKLIKE